MANPSKTVWLLPVFASALLAVGCDADKQSTTSPPPKTESSASAAKTPAKTAPAGEAGKGAPGGEKVKVVQGARPGNDDRFALEFDTPDAVAGKQSKVTVRVVPKKPWHMNLEFPTSLKVQAPDTVAVVNANMSKGDATLTDDLCQFDVAFTPSAAGEQTITGKFKFAVCQDEACSPVTKDVEFKVAVK